MGTADLAARTTGVANDSIDKSREPSGVQGEARHLDFLRPYGRRPSRTKTTPPRTPSVRPSERPRQSAWVV